MATLRWGDMPALVAAREMHACCAVRGNLVVIGGMASAGRHTSSVEMLSSEEGAFVNLPPLSCGAIWGAAAIAVDESDSALGQLLLIGGAMQGCGGASRTVHLVDLATGLCTRQRDLLSSCYNCASARLPGGGIRLPGGGIVCAGGDFLRGSSAKMWGAPEQGAPDAAWTWRHLPAMSVARRVCSGCVMSDSRFAVLGGSGTGAGMSLCEALAIGVDGGEQ